MSDNNVTVSDTDGLTPASAPKLSRRQILAGSAVGAAIGVGGFGMGMFAGRNEADPAVANKVVEFRGKHQSGIITPAQQQMIMVAFDMTASRKKDLITLLSDWSLAAERMQAGEPVNSPGVSPNVPPDDTGEAMGLPPAALSITFGFGKTLFKHPEDGDRFGIADRMPAPLAKGIPRMSAEAIDRDNSDGDLVIQICGEDPMVVLHAMHQFKRIAFGTASVKWMQLGYGRTSSTSTEQETPRNLFGFKDGTANMKAEDGNAELNEHLWIQDSDDGGSWAAGGTYLCTRKIHMMMEVWDELILREQERITGRDKLNGAPLSGGEEFDAPNFSATGENGHPLIDPDSHVATVHPDNNGGRRMLRRGYNYTEGIDKLGRLNAGLFFIAFVRDPQTNFVPILQRMSKDLMTEYLQHRATGLYLVPPGMGAGDTYVGQQLLEG